LTSEAYNPAQQVVGFGIRELFGNRRDTVHINYLRDIPLTLGILALLFGILTNGIEIKIKNDPECPQWLCRPMLLIIGTLLICFSFVGQLTPQ
jgi:hypothetical protein